MKKKLDIYSFLTDVPEEPKPEPIKEEVVETPVEPESVEPVEYKFKFREVVKEEKKVKKRNVFEFLVGKPAEETVEEVVEEPRIPRKKDNQQRVINTLTSTLMKTQRVLFTDWVSKR